jgi:hypothetical protein
MHGTAGGKTKIRRTEKMQYGIHKDKKPAETIRKIRDVVIVNTTRQSINATFPNGPILSPGWMKKWRRVSRTRLSHLVFFTIYQDVKCSKKASAR